MFIPILSIFFFFFFFLKKKKKIFYKSEFFGGQALAVAPEGRRKAVPLHGIIAKIHFKAKKEDCSPVIPAFRGN